VFNLREKVVRRTFGTATLLAAFFFDHTGAKKKAIKKETPGVVSRSAEREEGSAPSTAPPFEKRTRASA